MSELARALYDARTKGGVIDMGDYPAPADEDAAYALQAEVTAMFASAAVGWKLGATNEQTLELLGFERPFVGVLLETHCHANGAEVAVFAEQAPALETEFMVTLGADLPAREQPYSNEEVLAAVAQISPAFEIVSCRVRGGFAGAGLMLIADGAVNVAVVRGERAAGWRDADLSDHPLRIVVDGADAAAGSSNLLLWGDPLGAVAYLAAHPHTRARGLRRGDIVITGTCGGLIPLRPGMRAEADFGVLGKVACTVRA